MKASFKKLSVIVCCLVLILLISSTYFITTKHFNICIWQFRSIDNQTKYEAAIRFLLNHYPNFTPRTEVRSDGSLVNLGNYIPGKGNIIYYKSVDQFLTENPDCCVVQKSYIRGSSEGLKAFYDYDYVVSINYRYNYLNENHEMKSEMREQFFIVDACGNISNKFY